MTGPEQHADTVREGLEAAEGADFDAGRKDAEQVFKARLTSLDALVALAERADTLERELDEAREGAEILRDKLEIEREQARAEADRLREALTEWVRRLEAVGLEVPQIARAALADPQTKEQT